MARPDPTDIAQLVKLRRLASGLTQEQLARRAGVSLATVRSIETGRVKQPYKQRDVFRALGLEVDEEPVSLAYLSDDELVREVERRWPGKIGEILSGRPPRAPDDPPAETGRTA